MGGNIVFHESDKIITSTTIGVASRPGRNSTGSFGTIRKLYVDMMAFKNGVPSLADGVAVTFNKNYTNSIDGMDADKLSTFFTKEELSIKREGKLLSIERRKDVAEEDTVFLNISRLNTAAYQFNLRPVAFDENYSAFLKMPCWEPAQLLILSMMAASASTQLQILLLLQKTVFISFSKRKKQRSRL